LFLAPVAGATRTWWVDVYVRALVFADEGGGGGQVSSIKFL
jgi:hypothetical protein